MIDPRHIIEWLLAFALTMVAAAVAVAVTRHFWEAARQFRRIGASIAALDHSDVLAIVCEPCNGAIRGNAGARASAGTGCAALDDTGIPAELDVRPPSCAFLLDVEVPNGLATQYVVTLENGTVFGPFPNRVDAQGFAEFAAREIDPAEVHALCSPVGELLQLAQGDGDAAPWLTSGAS